MYNKAATRAKATGIVRRSLPKSKLNPRTRTLARIAADASLGESRSRLS